MYTSFSFDRKEFSSLPGEQESLEQAETEDEMQIVQHPLTVKASLAGSSMHQAITMPPTPGMVDTSHLKPQDMGNNTF